MGRIPHKFRLCCICLKRAEGDKGTYCVCMLMVFSLVVQIKTLIKCEPVLMFAFSWLVNLGSFPIFCPVDFGYFWKLSNVLMSILKL